ncbi:MAG: lipoyl(octanoyl) transferase LipB [Myxococcota bacterium]
MTRTIHVCRLGRVPYGPTHALQERLQHARAEQRIPDLLLLLEHDPVITLGRRAQPEHVLLPRETLAARGVEIHETGRGGDVTYHGPGQLVGYPIFDLSPDRRDVRRYVWSLEEAMIRTCQDHGVEAARIPGLNGAWVDGDKIGAVGVRISRWVTMHGFALNVDTELSHFDLIVPCGIRDHGVTALSKQTGTPLRLDDVGDHAAQHLAELHEADLRWHDGMPFDRPAA